MQNRRQRPASPFVTQRTDVVTWIYDHRAGVFSLISLTLAMAILFIGAKIAIGAPPLKESIVLDITTVEELQEEAERLQREVLMRQSAADYGSIRNAISNAGSSDLRDVGDMPDISDITDRANQTSESMNSNREAWDEGNREIEAMGSAGGGGAGIGGIGGGGGRGTGGAGSTQDGTSGSNGNASGSDARASGRVLVEFLLVDPLRTSSGRLPVPGYQSENFGEVVVDITVNHNGDVVSAKVNGSLSSGDARMHETALDAARRSRFNIDRSAPERHEGTITYTFVAQ